MFYAIFRKIPQPLANFSVLAYRANHHPRLFPFRPIGLEGLHLGRGLIGRGGQFFEAKLRYLHLEQGLGMAAFGLLRPRDEACVGGPCQQERNLWRTKAGGEILVGKNLLVLVLVKGLIGLQNAVVAVITMAEPPSMAWNRRSRASSPSV